MGETVFNGRGRLKDMDTGEIFEAQKVVKKVDGDAGFDKIWLGTILELVNEIGNAKMQILLWMLRTRDADNRVSATKDEIAHATGASRATVTRLLVALKAANVISEVRRSVWRLNPGVVFKGPHEKRMRVLLDYIDERVDMQPDLFESPAEAPGAFAERAGRAALDLIDERDLPPNVVHFHVVA